ncbi:MAG: ABC transporter ATP-binding protein [Saprospiraceae bacterium]|nr:ABC transporter ATP-binding protein [Saprospiraceae bacterium]
MEYKGKILEVKNLNVSFQTPKGVVPAAKDVSFELYAGQTLGLVGESGSGKSVTALSLMRLLPSFNCSLSGELLLHNAESPNPVRLDELPDGAMRKVRGRRIGMIFQEPMSSLNPVFRCGDQVSEALRLHLQLNADEARKLTLQWFEKVKLPDPGRVFRSYPHQLSGGQKQRVMIAMAMCCNPALLIADEPTTALDVTVQKAVLDLIRDLQQDTGAACLFISHDLGVISEIAQQVAVMHEGQIAEKGAVTQMLSAPQHPYTKGLLACRPPLNRRLRRLPVISDFTDGADTAPLPENTMSREEELTKAAELSRHPPILQVHKLAVSYPGRPPVHAVKSVDFQVHPGEVLGLVGESGCGKTTLGRALLRLTEAQSGEVLFRGENLLQLPPKRMLEVRKEVQIIFQDPYASLNPRFRIGKAIMEPMRLHGLRQTEEQCKATVVGLLQTVGLSEAQFDRFPHELSGGQRQRACIARALAVEPSLLICDESVSALDVSVQAQVLNLLQQLREARNLTMIFISHDLSVIRQISDRILVMKDGEIVESGFTAEVCNQPKSPYTQQLLEAVPGRAF